MGFRTTAEAVAALEKVGQLVRISAEVDANLELAEIQRRLYQKQSPAVLFTRVRGSNFPMLANLYGTAERMRILFAREIEQVRKLVELKADPDSARKRPLRYWNLPFTLWSMRPKIVRRGPILAHRIPLSQLPQLKCWPMDGGAFVTLPLVYSEHPDTPGWAKSNLGMYRVQISGNSFEPDGECGVHYQIHRGIGVHHAAAGKRGEPLRVNVIVGGPPALTVSAVMPLPEGLPELAFAGALGGRRVSLVPAQNGLLMPAEADFVISGTIDPTRTKPEGPFGDHLGYYSLTHDFPVLKVDAVYHRPGAIWPFTVVGRPPQEDTSFGEFIHDLTAPAIPAVLPGVHAVHAVDAAGVHPLLLAIGSERYVPYATRRKPQELLTLANAILGQGQLSLAKYLLIVAKEDNPALQIHHIDEFLTHLLERVDWTTDLHFHTRTTIDTLDYSAGLGINAGSKVVIAAAGPPRRTLGTALPEGFSLPSDFRAAKLALPGVLAIEGPKIANVGESAPELTRLAEHLEPINLEAFPLIVVVDDAAFVAQTLTNFLWVVFTRSDPASHITGVKSWTRNKHWGCDGPLIIDARWKPHMAPPLVEDPATTRRVDTLAARGQPLHGLIE